MTLGTATTAAVRRIRGARAIAPLRIVAAAAAQVHGWAATTEGRRRTAQVLRSLDPAAWQVTRNMRLPDGGHADHLAVGPTGVYLLVSRAWQGVVTVDHKGATITPEGRPAAAWTARGQHCSLAPAAAALGRALSTAGRSTATPQAVVVIWAPFPEGLAVSGGITYVAGDRLVSWMSDQRRRPDDAGRVLVRSFR
jgi:Nuclease-related domain